jgi:hypothetical protein
MSEGGQHSQTLVLLSETFRAPVSYLTCSPGGAAPPGSGEPTTDENAQETSVRLSSSRRAFHRCAFGGVVRVDP